MARQFLTSIIGLVIVVACGCHPAETGSGDVGGFGYFIGDVVATWNSDGRRMTLIDDFEYVDAKDRRWVAPAGTTVDGASIPSAFWTFIGGPFEGKYRFASVVHDIECERMTSSWEDVHRMFYEAMRCAGVSDSQAKTMYYAVYHFGPRWEPVEQSATTMREQPPMISPQQPSMASPEQPSIASPEQFGSVPEIEIVRSKEGRQMKRYQPPPPTQEELDQLQAFIQEENPNTAAIEQTSRESLRGRHRRQPGVGPNTRNTGESVRLGENTFTGAKKDWPSGRSRRNQNGEVPGNQLRLGDSSAAEFVSPVVDNGERQWVIDRVVSHFTGNNPGQQIPATYDVDQSSTEYRVRMQVYSQTSHGEATGYQDEQLLVRVSKAGEVLEVLR